MIHNQYLQTLRSFGASNLGRFRPITSAEGNPFKRLAAYLEEFSKQLKDFSKVMTDKSNELLIDAEKDKDIEDIDKLRSGIIDEGRNQINEFIKMYKPQ